MRILVTRPEPGATALADRLAASGHEAILAPLLAVRLLGREVAICVDGLSGLVVTSRNALRAIASRDDLQALTALPLFAVGDATAAAARTLGFGEVVTGAGRAADLPDVVRRRLGEVRASRPRLLHLAAETLAFDLAAALADLGVDLDSIVVYRSEPVGELPASAAAALSDATVDAVILMSPLTARTYRHLVVAAGLDHLIGRIRHFCLSKAVADALGETGESSPDVAGRPDVEAILELVNRRAAELTYEKQRSVPPG
ncbi:MAG: uroporphyrinogen-III synthase [Hyphomicrobiaceae bacterium]